MATPATKQALGLKGSTIGLDTRRDDIKVACVAALSTELDGLMRVEEMPLERCRVGWDEPPYW